MKTEKEGDGKANKQIPQNNHNLTEYKTFSGSAQGSYTFSIWIFCSIPDFLLEFFHPISE